MPLKKILNGIPGEVMRNKQRKIGSFMIAVGAIIELKGTNKILVLKRNSEEIHNGEWEMMYGRIDQFEELTDALKREIFEETGLEKITVKKLQQVWHIFRGEKSADTEVYGFTFICESATDEVVLSSEHSEYKWTTVDEALKLIKVPGIHKDVEIYKNERKKLGPIIVSDLDRVERFF